MLRWLTTVWLGLASAAVHADAARAAADLRVVVILDNSGSMNARMPGGGSRIEAAKKSLLTVLDQTDDDAEVGVLLLNSSGRGDWLIPLGPLDKPSVRAAVETISAGGPTPLGGCMKQAADALLKLRDAQRYGVYKLLVVTDGEATDGDLVERFLPDIQARGLLIDVIGVSMPQQHSLAVRANTYRNANDPASLEEAISAVVLGESTSDAAGDAGESDFELLAPLPAEVATASLSALVAGRNDPIGETAVAASPQEVGESPDGAGQRPSRVPRDLIPAPPGGAEAPPGGADAEGFSLSYLVFGVIVLIVVMRFISSIGKNR